MAKEILLERMHIEHFKGIEDLEIQFAPGQTDIYGDNATGKSTVADAYIWLMSGRDSRNSAAFGIKPVSSTGEVAQHGAASVVEATLIVDGHKAELRREYAEVWTQKRGSANKVFSGHETTFYIDTIPKTKGEYNSFIGSLIGEKTLRLLTSPEYFAGVLSEKERRAVLMDLFGNISIEDVFAADGSLRIIEALVDEYGIENLLRKLKNDRTRVNKQRNELPVRIDEANRAIAGAADIDEDEERRQLDKTNAQIRELDGQIAELRNGGIAGELNRLTAQIASLKEQAVTATHAATGAYRTELRRWETERRKLQDELQRAQSDEDRAQADIQRAQHDIELTRNEYRHVRDERWDGDTVCPTCGQELPEARVEALKAEYNVRQSERLETISRHGNELKAQIEAASQKAAEAAERSREILGRFGELDAREPQQPERCTGFDAEIADLERQREELLAASDSEKDDRMKALEARASQLEVIAENYRANITAADEARRTRTRIEQLSAEERKLSAELEKLDQQIDACERFTRTQVGLVEDRINSQFKIAKFKLFSEQVNGGIAECCELTVDGVPWADLNSGMRIQAGCDVINTLSREYGVKAPTIIDNAESVTTTPQMDGQMIRMIVSEPDKALRVQEVA